jgi:hypothetical protein
MTSEGGGNDLTRLLLDAAIRPTIQRYAPWYVLLPLAAFACTETRKIRQVGIRAAYTVSRDK